MKKHILIVEDEQTLLDSLIIMIKRLDNGFEIYSANNGNQALELINVSDIDLLITDIFMPDMDGLELIRAVKEKFPDIKILGMTGAGPHYLRAAKSFGASFVLSKPFGGDEFISAIHKVLN